MALRARYPGPVDRLSRPAGRLLARTGVTPNALTTLGLMVTGVAAWLVAVGRPALGGAVLVLGGALDVLDGAVARASDRSTPFGGFYDAVSDRISDGLILGVIAWWVRDEPRLFALAITALVAAEVTSYVRAKAEAIDLYCRVGMLERAERAGLLIVGLLLHDWMLEPVLWVLAVGGIVTVMQRIHHVWCQIDRDVPRELLALSTGGHAWNRAFMRAARAVYGQRNVDGALSAGSATGSHPRADASADPEPPAP